ncbi:MAG: DUF397 domain-containing protein [Streptosporangiaceae bacterium]
MDVIWRKSSSSGANGGNCLEVGMWRKSSHSGGNGGGCVEVGAPAGVDQVLVRDTKDRQGPVLAFTPQAWRRFAQRVKATT